MQRQRKVPIKQISARAPAQWRESTLPKRNRITSDSPDFKARKLPNENGTLFPFVAEEPFLGDQASVFRHWRVAVSVSVPGEATAMANYVCKQLYFLFHYDRYSIAITRDIKESAAWQSDVYSATLGRLKPINVNILQMLFRIGSGQVDKETERQYQQTESYLE